MVKDNKKTFYFNMKDGCSLKNSSYINRISIMIFNAI